MAEYVYQAGICKVGAITIGVDAAANAAARTEWESTYKDQAEKVNGIVLASTAIQVDNTWEEFKAQVALALPGLWADVLYTEDDSIYRLYLIEAQ